mgnify:CR=1 FL=1
MFFCNQKNQKFRSSEARAMERGQDPFTPDNENFIRLSFLENQTFY